MVFLLFCFNLALGFLWTSFWFREEGWFCIYLSREALGPEGYKPNSNSSLIDDELLPSTEALVSLPAVPY